MREKMFSITNKYAGDKDTTQFLTYCMQQNCLLFTKDTLNTEKSMLMIRQVFVDVFFI